MQRKAPQAISLLTLGTMLGAFGCGTHGKINAPASSTAPASFSGENAQGTSSNSTSVSPPKEYYSGLLEKALKDAEATGGSQKLADQQSASPTVYLNFDGQTVQKGFAAGQSFIPCSASVTIPPSTLSQSTQDAIFSSVKSFFADAGVNINLVDVRPKSGSYTTVLVGGNYDSLGCGKAAQAVLSLAPLDKGNLNPNDIGFAFPTEQSATIQAAIIARAIGHTFGLENTDNPEDVMSMHISDATKGFASGKALGSGTSQDDAADLKHALGQDGTNENVIDGGSGAQVPGLVNLADDLAKLPGLENVSGTGKVVAGLKPQEVVNISSLNSQIRDVLPASVAIPSLEKAVTAIALADKAAGGSGSGKTNVGGVSQVFQKVLSNPQALNTAGGAIAAIAALSGQSGSAAAIGAILGAFGQAAPAGQTTPTQTQPAQLPTLPDFAGLLGISSLSDITKLLGPYLNGHIAVINGNFAGDTKAALISMVKVGYAQAFAAAIASMPKASSTNGVPPKP